VLLNDLFKQIKDHCYVLGSTHSDITGDNALDFDDSVVALKYVVLPLALLQSQGPQSVKSEDSGAFVVFRWPISSFVFQHLAPRGARDHELTNSR
jgi:hypothetical protein